MSSILNDTKKVIGGAINGDAFDLDLIIAINANLARLTQVGVGPAGGYRIKDDVDEWEDFVGDDEVLLGLVQMFVWARVRMQFDPPASSAVAQSMEKTAEEYLVTISYHVDPGNPPY